MSDESENGQETEQKAKRKISEKTRGIVGAAAVVIAALVIGIC